LHARLHARQRDARDVGRRLLREALELDERDGLAVGRREPRDERRHAAEERALLVVALRAVLVERGHREGALSVVVRDRVSRDRVHPRAEALVLDVGRLRVDAQEHVLHDVVHVAGGDASRDEALELAHDDVPLAPLLCVDHPALDNALNNTVNNTMTRSSSRSIRPRAGVSR
jgi:hypothetical protein